MTDFYRKLYATQPQKYDQLVSREDQRGRLLEALMEIAPFAGVRCADFGAGTGRITRQLALLAERVFGMDHEMAMLRTAHQLLEESGLVNWHLLQADNRAAPLADNSVDLAVSGWSIAHMVAWYPDDWQLQVTEVINEMQRVTAAGGTVVLIETMGTNQRQPEPPTPELAALYAWWEDKYNLDYRWIRTDYQFESMQEADDLMRFFFGDAMTDEVLSAGREIVPECTGIWWMQV